MIENLLTETTIKLEVRVDDWKEAIDKGGKLLLKAGKIQASYIEAMKETVQELGGYVVIVPGIAIPHARPEAGVKKKGMSLLTLQEPVEFGHKKNDPVKIVICFCAVDDSSHTEALAELMQLLRTEKFTSFLKEGGRNKEKVLHYIKEVIEE